MTALFMGIDGGGTRTRAVVCGTDLVVIGRGAAYPPEVGAVRIAIAADAELYPA